MNYDTMTAVITLNADIVDDIERTRIANENRLRQLTADEAWGKGVDPAVAIEVQNLTAMIDNLCALEHAAVRNLERAMKNHPLGPWVNATIGIGLKTTARFLGAIGDPAMRRGPAQLWAYCGLHTVNGEAPRKKSGQKANWNNVARMRVYLMAESCIKQSRSPYRSLYDRARVKYDGMPCDRDYMSKRVPGATEPQRIIAQVGDPLPPFMAHNRAMRLVMKAIVKDVWREARKARGLAAGRPMPGPDELLHHKSEDKTDNRLDNLELITRADHSRMHAATQPRQRGRFARQEVAPCAG